MSGFLSIESINTESEISQVLSLGRNQIKSLQGVEAAAETLEQLWLSYNQVYIQCEQIGRFIGLWATF